MNFFYFHIGDYASATRHLSWDEDLAYRRLMDAYYMREGSLPRDKTQIYRLVVAITKSQKVAVDSVLAEFFQLGESGFSNRRCDEEISSASSKRQKARQAAAFSVESRSRNNKELRSARLAAAREKGKHSQEEWETLVEICGHRCVKCGSDAHLDKDHIIPIYQGGSDGLDNLQPLCARCNAHKGPEAEDFRPSNWRALVERKLDLSSTDAQRTLNGRSTDVELPLPTTHYPVEKEEEKNNLTVVPKETKAPRKLGTRLSEDFLPDLSCHRLAEELLLGATEGQQALDNFLDYWRSVPGAKGLKLDWQATFRNWLREFARRKNPHGTVQKPNSIADGFAKVRAVIAEAERREREGGGAGGEGNPLELPRLRESAA